MFHKIMTSIKNRLLAGVVVLVPLAVTYMVLRALFNILLDVFRPILSHVLIAEEMSVTAEILVTLLLGGLALYIVGGLSRMIVVKRIINFGENVLAKIPVVKFLYLTSKQVLDSIQLMKRKSLNKVVAVEYPRKGIKCLAFVTGEMRIKGEEGYLVNIFLPSTPNPTTGFFLMLTPDQVWDVNVSMEDATKMLISGGIIVPPNFEFKPYAPLSSGRSGNSNNEQTAE